MPDYQYLIVGGGMTAHAAARGIRSVDATGSIGILAEEPHRPYARPPLSKALWKGQPVESIWLAEIPGVKLHAGGRAIALDRQHKRVDTAGGERFGYEKLLLATGGTPRRLPRAEGDVVYFRTLDDYDRLRRLRVPSRVAVIGGGFIGSEIAAALAMNGHRVTMIFPGEGIGDRLFPRDLALFLNGYFAERGVEVRAREKVVEVARLATHFAVRTSSTEVAADAVVVGIGIEPNTALAAAAGIAVDDGILVDEALRTSDADIFAAGDVARFHNPALGKRIRVEHEDNANTAGYEAGRAMAGARVAYRHLPFFYSDLFDVGYEAVGDLDPRCEVIADWKVPHREGFVYYVAGGRVRGVLTWGVFGQVDAARALIAEIGPLGANDLVGRLPR